MENAAEWGALDCLKYAIENGCTGKESACRHASRDLKCLKYLREELDCPWDVEVSNACAKSTSGNIDCLRYCLKHGCPVDETTMALATVDVRKVKLLRDVSCPWDKRALHAAAENCNTSCLKYLLKHNCPGKEDVAPHAAHHLPTLQCVHAHGCVLLPEAYECAMKSDDPLQVVKFLFQNGCPWPREACAWFARAKRVDCLRFARENGAEWNSKTCTAAVQYTYFRGSWDRNGERSLECLQYLREEGCPWDEQTDLFARVSSHNALMEYVKLHNCPSMFTFTAPVPPKLPGRMFLSPRLDQSIEQLKEIGERIDFSREDHRRLGTQRKTEGCQRDNIWSCVPMWVCFISLFVMMILCFFCTYTVGGQRRKSNGSCCDF